MRKRLSATGGLSRFPPSFHGRRELGAVLRLHRTPPAPRRDDVGHAAGFVEVVKLPVFVMLRAPLPDGALPADVTAASLAFNPFEFLDFILLRPDQFHDWLRQALRAHPFAPGERMFAPPLALGALQADVVADPLTFDPPILFNFLSLGPNHSSDGIMALMPCLHNVPPSGIAGNISHAGGNCVRSLRQVSVVSCSSCAIRGRTSPDHRCPPKHPRPRKRAAQFRRGDSRENV